VAMDSNARSTSWHDTTTNNRGKTLEEFIAGNQLYIINEDSPRKTFQSSRGTSNIDLTIVNNSMLAAVTHWDIVEKESVSDHKNFKFGINFERDSTNISKTSELRYIIRKQQNTEFYKNLFIMISETSK